MPEESVETSATAVVDTTQPTETEPVAADTTTHVAETQEVVGEKPHPLSPEGDRFKQVYARAKSAEAELQREREERIRLEERVKAKEEAESKQQASQHVYTHAELLQAAQEGRISEADARTIADKQQADRILRESETRLERKLQESQRDARVQAETDRYIRALPAMTQVGSAERAKLESTYQELLSLGYAATKATQLVAAKAAFGDVTDLEKAHTLRTTQVRETTMETHASGGRTSTTAGKDPIAKLTPEQKVHYERMIAKGGYSGWDEVRSELTWARKPKTR